MKHLFFLAFVLFFSVNLMNAQGQTSNEPSDHVKSELAILKKADLNLTDRQVARITSVLMAQEAIETRNLKAVEGNKSVVEQRMKDLKANKINNIKGALTEQQVEKFNALKLDDKF